MSFLNPFSNSENENERREWWRERLSDSHVCPHCDEPIGNYGSWTSITRPTEQGAVIANSMCPYCSGDIWLTADNRIVVLK